MVRGNNSLGLLGFFRNSFVWTVKYIAKTTNRNCRRKMNETKKNELQTHMYITRHVETEVCKDNPKKIKLKSENIV